MERNEFLDRLASGRMTRRGFAKALGAAGVGVVAMPMIPKTARAEEQAVLFEWAGYEVPELHPAYAEKYGAEPDAVLFGDEDEAYSKVAAGFRPDISHPCSPLAKKWKDAGLTQAIDTSRLSNWPDVFPVLQDLDGTRFDGEQWFVPFDWGRTSITYRTDLVDIDEESWSLLWDERYKGRMSVIDAAGDALAAAAIYVGYNEGFEPFNMTLDQLDLVLDKMREQRPLLRFYTNDMTSVEQALASGELVAAMTWDDSVANLKKQGVPVKFMKPKEGVLTWVCGLVLIKDPPHPDKAYDLIDAMLAPEAGAFLINEDGYGHSNAKSFDLVSDERLTELDIPKNPLDLLSSGVFFKRFSNYEKTVAGFEEVKAGF